jgi:sugar diacid utilization regulator
VEVKPPITLGQLFDRLGFTLLSVAGQRLDAGGAVRSLAIHDALDPQPISTDALVLGVGLSDGQQASTLIRAVESANVAGVVLRESLVSDPAVLTAIDETGVAVFGLLSGASWIQVTSILMSALGLVDDRPVVAEMVGDSESDLFALANSIAVLVHGPVTIEDTSSRIVAFSANQDKADDARKESVLGLQVPETYSSTLQKRGAFQQIYASATPVFIESLGRGVRPRVSMRLQVGGEILGSIWVVVDGPLSLQRQQGLVEAANVVALIILRARVTNDSALRIRSALVSSLLDGDTGVRQSAMRSGLGMGRVCVLALGVSTESGADSELDLQRLSSVFNMYLRAAHPHAQAALLNETIYAVLPLEKQDADSRAKDCARDFVARIRQSTRVLAGVGTVVADVTQLPKSRQDADMVLRVLRTPSSQSSETRVASMADVQVESLLLRMTDLLNNSHEPMTGSLATLVEYDSVHNSDLVETLNSWLEFFGDVAGAADSLHVHKNTFRYRLRRLSEIAGIDLSDPIERFGLMLQLRLLSYSIG